MIKAEFNEQCYFDFEMQLYGFRDKTTGKLMEVYYSGMHMGLPFAFDSKEEARGELQKYTSAKEYTVEKFTDMELMTLMNEINIREQLAIS